MPAWIHRTTLDQFHSVASAELPEAVGNYIEDPDLSSVLGQPKKYWKIVVNAVQLQTAGEQTATDAALDAAATTSNRGTITTDVDRDVSSTDIGIRLRAMIQLMSKRDNYLTNRIIELQDALDAMKASTGAAQNIRDAIPASWLTTNTRPRGDAIQDFKDDINAGNAD